VEKPSEKSSWSATVGAAPRYPVEERTKMFLDEDYDPTFLVVLILVLVTISVGLITTYFP
jgi:hypothetical protein